MAVCKMCSVYAFPIIAIRRIMGTVAWFGWPGSVTVRKTFPKTFPIHGSTFPLFLIGNVMGDVNFVTYVRRLEFISHYHGFFLYKIEIIIFYSNNYTNNIPTFPLFQDIGPYRKINKNNSTKHIIYEPQTYFWKSGNVWRWFEKSGNVFRMCHATVTRFFRYCNRNIPTLSIGNVRECSRTPLRA